MSSQADRITGSRREKKLDLYLKNTGIKNPERAQKIIQGHFDKNRAAYPYVLFRDNSLYLFTVAGLSEVKAVRSSGGADYLRFDGERITQLEAQYYLGPESGRDDVAVFWGDGGGSANNNNNNNNNNGNNGNNG